MAEEDALYLCLKEYDALVQKIRDALNKPHALNNIRLAIQKFREIEGRYPREMDVALQQYLANCRRQEQLGQILYGAD